MEFFKQKTQIDFLGIKKYTTILSVVMIIISLFFIFTKGLNLGLDFTGGYQVQIHTSQAVDSDVLADKLEKIGFKHTDITTFGENNNYLIKFAPDEVNAKAENLDEAQQLLHKDVEQTLKAQVQSVDYIGPQVGKELASNGILAIIIALVCILIYISARFEMKFGISACLALLHDPIVILGVFAAFQLEFNLTVLAAVLAVIGYSLNDTVVIYDRVRENFRKMRKASVTEVVNRGINDTLSRTILTSGLTMLVVVVLFFFGGSSVHNFSLALILGIIVGTYSSIYVAGVVAVVLGLNRESLLPKQIPTDDTPIL
ncbi:protein translocase subunit SecF [Francisella adeliensis]|uniref:Protein-export membrane protein SecF n=1 Tax=Francisella adeliensis TaxID=2007306 RepID=A0A2Z4Y0Z3_9GAMM|nr:protein translocase subunit SecF [Francisella adeliensis]AXA34225.1 protein translocase subunit SecF [Francisella adeliensis]MBK2084866.1 protein translocase subunit SecF [Francisella adeliensis]MBK2096303.1 protein translocase subunit SecF [Francisella adeliensis]QIW12469.1 protein translocase subunit SecF [Francisella adeliensis]QIW14342.1 protein translocase subunit SecF [Francisella adeliensis]